MATFNLGSPRSIATQGLLSNNAVTIATQGFLETQLSDLIFGGGAGVSQTFSVTAATNGLTFGGVAGVNNTWIVIAVSGMTIGGAAATFFIPSVPSVGRPGGTAGPRSGMRRPVSAAGFGARKKKWIEPIKPLEPKDYWKRIELAIELAKEREKPKTHEFIGSGTITLTPVGIAAPVFRDQTSEPIHSYDLTPTNDYSIEGLFVNDITTDDLVEIEDEMLLNDQIASGDYDLNIGKKQRFVHRPEDIARLSFGHKAEVEHTDYILELVEKEDREFILGEKTESDNDDDELRLLGVID